jgi:dihydrofolate synthase/folylpolyglutamate synthase
MSINNYTEALAYIYSYISYNPADTRRWNLDRLNGLLERMGNPHRQYPSILIAGTKGKGSTSALCESILRAAGYKTGLYTSPHIHSFRERIRLGGELLDGDNLASIINRYRGLFETTPDLTTFELITAIAFTAFAEAEIEAGVVEVGLGGRLDATNTIDAAVAVITPISYDHMQILGDTLTLIAGEKAGIIRPGALVVSAPQVDEARQTIERVCQERNAKLVLVDEAYWWTVKDGSTNRVPLDGRAIVSLNGQSISIRVADSLNPSPLTVYVPLIGEHQVINTLTAVAAVTSFAEHTSLPVTPEAIKVGVKNVSWPGRMEVLHQSPHLIIDSAMNGDSAEKLAKTLRYYFSTHEITFIFGVSNDHPVEDMLMALLPLAKRTFVVASRHPRAEKPARIAQLAMEMGYQTISMPDVPTALDRAWEIVEGNDVVCVAGSLFLAADAREAWLKKNNLPLPPIDPMLDFRLATLE